MLRREFNVVFRMLVDSDSVLTQNNWLTHSLTHSLTSTRPTTPTDPCRSRYGPYYPVQIRSAKKKKKEVHSNNTKAQPPQ